MTVELVSEMASQYPVSRASHNKELYKKSNLFHQITVDREIDLTFTKRSVYISLIPNFL